MSYVSFVSQLDTMTWGQGLLNKPVMTTSLCAISSQVLLTGRMLGSLMSGLHGKRAEVIGHACHGSHSAGVGDLKLICLVLPSTQSPDPLSFDTTASCFSWNTNLFPLSRILIFVWVSVRFSSVAQLCLTLCDLKKRSMPGLPVHQQLLESTQTMSTESVMPSSHLILCPPLLFLPPIPPRITVFPMSQLFAWDGQSMGVSGLASVLPKNTQDWSPLEWTGWIFLQSKGLSRVFSNTTVQKHPFFSAQLSSQSNSHIHTWPLEKP